MKIITNKIIPFNGFGAMNILGLIFTRKQASEITLRTKRHEQVHTYQQYEILGVSALVSLVLCNIFTSWWYLLGVVAIPFLLYLVGFIFEMVVPPYHNAKLLWEEKKFVEWAKKIWMDAYSDNCFEREAYMNDQDRNYLATRSLFAWVGYIIPKSERKGK
jgi:hypothetical protein